ncbi:MAG: hypothetical protein DWH94_09045, partial [Planctomycetota bacterium]
MISDNDELLKVVTSICKHGFRGRSPTQTHRHRIGSKKYCDGENAFARGIVQAYLSVTNHATQQLAQLFQTRTNVEGIS